MTFVITVVTYELNQLDKLIEEMSDAILSQVAKAEEVLKAFQEEIFLLGFILCCIQGKIFVSLPIFYGPH